MTTEEQKQMHLLSHQEPIVVDDGGNFVVDERGNKDLSTGRMRILFNTGGPMSGSSDGHTFTRNYSGFQGVKASVQKLGVTGVAAGDPKFRSALLNSQISFTFELERHNAGKPTGCPEIIRLTFNSLENKLTLSSTIALKPETSGSHVLVEKHTAKHPLRVRRLFTPGTGNADDETFCMQDVHGDCPPLAQMELRALRLMVMAMPYPDGKVSENSAEMIDAG